MDKDSSQNINLSKRFQLPSLSIKANTNLNFDSPRTK